MNELKKIDVMAYIRYASIFKKINSIDEFVEEIKKAEDLSMGLKFEAATVN